MSEVEPPNSDIAPRSPASVASRAWTKVFQELASKATCRNSLDLDTFGMYQPLTRGFARAAMIEDMMGFVYILLCGDGKRYFGSTSDLGRRLLDHQGGRVRATKGRLPVRLAYFEELQTLAQARQRERAFKNGRTRRKSLERMLAEFPHQRPAPFA